MSLKPDELAQPAARLATLTVLASGAFTVLKLAGTVPVVGCAAVDTPAYKA
jgi:hypothetical protein